MQVTPGTFQSIRPQVERLLGREASVQNPFDNLLGGALLWRKYLDQTDGDVEAAARLYHGGENPAGHGPRTRQYGIDIERKFAALAQPR
jgi:soluble lytic murein transglycosylase-like protein